MKRILLLIVTAMSMVSYAAEKQTIVDDNQQILAYSEVVTFETNSSKRNATTQQVTVYWDACGDFFAFDVKGEDLLRTNLKPFSAKQYQTLYQILNDSDSPYHHKNYTDLSDAQAENKYHAVDAVSGATSSAPDLYVNGAIRTTSLLWHRVHEDAPVVEKAEKEWSDEQLVEIISDAAAHKVDYCLMLHTIEWGTLGSDVKEALHANLNSADNYVYMLTYSFFASQTKPSGKYAIRYHNIME